MFDNQYVLILISEMISATVSWLTLLSIVEKSTAECPLNWEVGARGDKCYMFSSDRVYWANALNQCEDKGGTLVSVTDQTINDRLRKGNGREYWIGLTVTTEAMQWYWSDGAQLTNELSWARDEPSGDVTCARLTTNGTIADRECTHEYYFICQADAVDGSSSWLQNRNHWFYFSNEAKNRYYASKYCLNNNGYLAREAVKHVLNQGTPEREYWIGISRRHWTDGSPYLWHNFDSDGEGIHDDGTASCYYLDWQYNRWAKECSRTKHYICERENERTTSSSTSTSTTISTTLPTTPSTTTTTVTSSTPAARNTNDMTDQLIVETSSSVPIFSETSGFENTTPMSSTSSALLNTLIGISALIVVLVIIIIPLAVIYRRRVNKSSGNGRLQKDGESQQTADLSGESLHSSAQMNTNKGSKQLGGNAAQEQTAAVASDEMPIYAVPNKKKGQNDNS